MHRVRRAWSDEGGQALVVVASLLATLVMLPVGVQLLATGQAPVANAAAYQQQALEAARAGLADYINHAETYDSANYATNSTSYSKYCSSGAFSACSSLSPARSVDSSNPAFVSTFGGASWVTVESGNTAGNAAYQYVVDTSGVGNTSCPTPYTVYAVGKAGAGTHYVYQELKAVIQDVPGTTVVCPAPTPSGSTCTTNTFSVTVPQGAGYAKLVLYGGAGGAGVGGGTGGQSNGGDGATETAYVQVTPGQTLTFTAGGAGADGNFSLLNLFGNGGQPGCSGSPGLEGGTGGGAGVGLLSDEGGGGGAASGVCWGTATSSTCNASSLPSVCSSSPPSSSTTCMMAVAGGGGGQGGDNSSSGLGGYYNNSGTWTAGGQQGSGGLGPGAGGPAGGTSGAANSTVGGNGSTTGIGILTGTGGGAGGGDCSSCASNTKGGGGGGSAGGLCVIVCLLGAGGGGGAGASVAMTAAPGCTNSTSATTLYPVPGGSGYNGAVDYTFYSSSSSCNGSAKPGAWSLLVQPVRPNSVYSSVLS